MGARDDNPFARWSRRKQAARSVDQPEPEGVPPDRTETEEVAPAEPAGTSEPVAQETAEPAEPLPRLEDLTADSDLSAFLRKGVPQALKSAAMRKMWSLDPNIRDHVGLAEYAWDFNQPGSMRGFGALGPGEAVVDFLSKAARAAAAPEHDETPADEAVAARPNDRPAESEADAPHDRVAAADDPPASSPPVERQPAPEPETAEDRENEAEQAPPPARPRHGGAMPR